MRKVAYHVGDAVLDLEDVPALRTDHLTVLDHNLYREMPSQLHTSHSSPGEPKTRTPASLNRCRSETHLEQDVMQRLEQLDGNVVRSRKIR